MIYGQQQFDMKMRNVTISYNVELLKQQTRSLH